MIELTQEDATHVVELGNEVRRVLDRITLDAPERAALTPLVWQELRAAHAANKSQRVQNEIQQKAKELGVANQSLPMTQGYFGQKL